ncbi:MAG TPA: cyclic pyranopterin monophosphate synthase MoaC [Syntrophomonadaceae bacterium]|nr:cyclic pyranopterin monophosphate synthase MoaC [Syntrophomonadaceae bacterium]
MSDFTHINEQGRAKMVDITTKEDTARIALAKATIKMELETLQMIKTGGVKKGDVLGVAQVGGIMGAKQTANLIPMCHPLTLSGVDINFEFDEEGSQIIIRGTVKTTGKTGVEMEALTGVSIAALTIYDMCKAIDRWMVIKEIKLLEKSGGKSGHLIREFENK